MKSLALMSIILLSAGIGMVCQFTFHISDPCTYWFIGGFGATCAFTVYRIMEVR